MDERLKNSGKKKLEEHEWIENIGELRSYVINIGACIKLYEMEKLSLIMFLKSVQESQVLAEDLLRQLAKRGY